jgi:hypothetical protein
MSNMREDSKKEWQSAATIEHFKVGCLQRIADAVEQMAVSYDTIIRDRDRFERWYKEERERNKKLWHRNIGLRGAITRLRKKRK